MAVVLMVPILFFFDVESSQYRSVGGDIRVMSAAFISDILLLEGVCILQLQCMTPDTVDGFCDDAKL